MNRSRNRYNDHKEAPMFQLPAPKIYLMLLMLSMAFLFLSFSLAYVYTRTQNGANGVHLPPIFLGNALLLVLSSWTINRANKAYLADDTLAYQQALLWTLILTLVFLIAQIAAWTVFKATLLGDNIGNGSNYLYAISGLHFAHVVGGLPFLSVFWWVSIKRMKEPVSVLIYFSDPTKKLRLELLTMYWHFLDGLWVFLMLFFLVNML
jgi:cytochrome c oxidase subunit 3